jgi:hypothetical protein
LPWHLKVYEIHRCTVESLTSVLPVVRRRRNTKALHLVKQCGALQAESGGYVEQMISRKLTFDEAVNTPDFTIMAKQRLRVIQRDLFEQLDAIGLA